MKRTRQQQTAIWKRQKKLTLQLFAFSFLYIIVWFPTTMLAILHALVFLKIRYSPDIQHNYIIKSIFVRIEVDICIVHKNIYYEKII
jgi:hypothetical protein